MNTALTQTQVKNSIRASIAVSRVHAQNSKLVLVQLMVPSKFELKKVLIV